MPGAGTGKEMVWGRERGWRPTKERKMGSRTEAGIGRERERGRGWRSVDEHRMGTGTGAGMEMKAVGMGTGTRMGTGTGTRIGSGRAEEGRRSARNRTRVVDAMRKTGETWVERGKLVEKKGCSSRCQPR